jgi:hypothetical protein
VKENHIINREQDLSHGKGQDRLAKWVLSPSDPALIAPFLSSLSIMCGIARDMHHKGVK